MNYSHLSRDSVVATMVLAVSLIVCAETQAQTAPYPQSSAISGISYNWPTHRRLAPGSDNWPITWADDGHQYTSWGDGGGFGGTNDLGRASLGVARVEGPASGYTGFNRYGGVNQEFSSSIGGKSYGMISINGTFYMWVSPGSDTNNYSEARLYYSTNHGGTWTSSNVVWTQSQGVVLPTILQFGQDYAGARDGYVYSHFINLKNSGGLGIQTPGEIVLARVPVASILNQGAYEWYSGMNAGASTWTSNIGQRQPVFRDTNGVGWTIAVSYNAGLQRYLLTTEHSSSFQGKFGLFDSTEPWGPWTTVTYVNSFGSPTISPDTFFWNFSNKWMSQNGKQFVMVFSGINSNDSWNTVEGQFTTTSDIIPPNAPTGLRIITP